jgi:hypothetical protein
MYFILAEPHHFYAAMDPRKKNFKRAKVNLRDEAILTSDSL